MCNSSPRTPQDTISGNLTMKLTFTRIPPPITVPFSLSLLTLLTSVQSVFGNSSFRNSWKLAQFVSSSLSSLRSLCLLMLKIFPVISAALPLSWLL
jgi:hypothetical protein